MLWREKVKKKEANADIEHICNLCDIWDVDDRR